MNTLTIDLPSSVSEEEATFFLAVKLYEAQRISLGKAAELAGFSKRDFMERLPKACPSSTTTRTS